MNDTRNGHYEKIFNTLDFGILIVADNGSIIDCNLSAKKLLGLPASDIINHPLTEILPIEDHIEELLSGNTVLNCQVIVRNKAFSVNTKKGQTSKELIFTLVPVTKFEISDEITQTVDLPIHDILNASQDEVFITDIEGRTLFINSPGRAYYGIDPQEMLGENVGILAKKGYFSPSVFPIVKKRREKVSMIQRTITGKTVHVIANPVFNSENVMTHIIYTGRDITEIKNLRKKIERNEFLLNAYKSELEKLQSFNTLQTDLISISPKMVKILHMANRIAQVDSTILITGESGVGKGVIAKFIHDNSPRNEHPLIHINCGAIPESLIESELFGYQSGAFTGADKNGRKGLIEQANRGTLFLDEIGEMPVNLQVKLLKVLQERKVQPIGSTATLDVDIRIIAATNKDLKELVNSGQFREDLFYRLNVVPIHIPPLRDRPEDVSHMIDYFMGKMNEKYNLSTFLSLEVENALTHHEWPGNVRELENVVERLVVTSENNEITMSDLPENFFTKEKDIGFLSIREIAPLKEAKEELEKQLIKKAYKLDKSSYKVANLLGINQSTAIRKINKYIGKEE